MQNESELSGAGLQVAIDVELAILFDLGSDSSFNMVTAVNNNEDIIKLLK